MQENGVPIFIMILVEFDLINLLKKLVFAFKKFKQNILLSFRA